MPDDILGSPPNRVAVFTRFPKAGTTKTRLIPAIGAEAAAALQRRLTEHALAQLAAVDALVEVHFTGGTFADVEQWLPDADHIAQVEGDLGTRMAAVFKSSEESFAKVAIVGTDVPELGARDIEAAFAALEAYDLAVGPAADGGYYLIAARRLHRSLFEGVDWDSPRVFSQTIDRALTAGLSVATLRELHDIDTPDDLALLPATLRPPTAAPQ